MIKRRLFLFALFFLFLFAVFWLFLKTGDGRIIPLGFDVQGTIFLSRDCLVDFTDPRKGAQTGIRLGRTDVLLDSGWYESERWGTWAGPEQAILKLAVPHERFRFLFLKCKAYPGLPRDCDQTMDVMLNGTLCRRLTLKRQMIGYRIPLPTDCLTKGVNELRFRFSHSHPDKKGTRDLAVGFRRLWLGETGDFTVRDHAAIDTDADRSMIRIKRSGKLLVSLKTSRPGDRIRFKSRFQGDGTKTESRGRCRLTLLKFDEDTTELVACHPTLTLDNRHSLSETEINLSGGPGRYCLSFDVELPEGTVSFKLSEVAFIAENIHGDTSEKGGGKKGRPYFHEESWPHIIMIVLDAARADHFGTPYGYHRDTVPGITRAMTGSLFFKNAMAQAPYTVCSIPTMITGLSFVIHGVTELDDGLSGQETTLAEYLGKLNYHRICYSATINHSRRLGFDQGYDDFIQTWKLGVSHETSIDPFFLSQKVIEKIKKGFPERPVFLLIHYVPPHAPYRPARGFDRFSDPQYQGPCDGSVDYLASLRNRNTLPDQSDIEAMIALYDGNLMMVDQAVSMVFQQLKQSGMWDHSLIIITSDHGEAFFEHGKHEHNSTLYREMIHVPLVIKLPATVSASGINTQHPVSLEDLVPTVLGLLGQVPDARVSGLDILSRDNLSLRRNRRLVMRTVSAAGYFGLRFGKWKLIHHRSGKHIELYDMSGDPEESSNRLLDDPVFSAQLCFMLVDELRPRAPVYRPGKKKAMEKSTREMLKTLGYTD